MTTVTKTHQNPIFLLLKVTQRDPYRASLVSMSVLLIYFDSDMLNKQKVAIPKYYTPSSTQRPAFYNGHFSLFTRWWSCRGSTEYQSKGFLHGSPTNKGIYKAEGFLSSRYSSYSFRFVGGKAPSLVRSPRVGRGQGWICGGISGSGKTRYHHINSESN